VTKDPNDPEKITPTPVPPEITSKFAQLGQ
jgi:hypothetical protein